MKKIFCVMATLVAALMVTSCDPKTSPLQYDVTLTAVANGHVAFNTPVGVATLKGDASVEFVTEPEQKVNASTSVPKLTDVLQSNGAYDAKTVAFAQRVVADYESSWGVKEAEGYYQIDVVGYVIEPTTGLTLAIDFHWPNQPNEIVVLGVAVDTVAVK